MSGGTTGGRPCAARTAEGAPCRAHPRKGNEYCFLHDPDSVDEAAKARTLGGYRRRREGLLETTYELDDELSLEKLERLHHIALIDALALDNGVARDRTLLLAVRTGLELMRFGDLAARLRVVELAILGVSPAVSPPRVAGPRFDGDDVS